MVNSYVTHYIIIFKIPLSAVAITLTCGGEVGMYKFLLFNLAHYSRINLI